MKPFWTSKTIWTNALIFGASVIAGATGHAINLSAEQIAGIITGINIFLRFITKDKVTIA